MTPRSGLPTTPSLVHPVWGLRQSALTPIQSVDDIRYHNTYTDKKEKKIFLIYKEIQKGAVAKSYICMRKGFLIYEEMRKYLVIYEEAATLI
jgi:hypothetical protein